MSAAKNYVELMLLHCGKTLAKMDGRTRQDWENDENLRDAVCMRLMSLTDCIKEYLKETPSVAERFPHIPWDNIVRFRDKIAHHYEGIDCDVVWEILESDITPLHEAIKNLARDDAELLPAHPQDRDAV
jgi:uncharacterized protein with HEPN domain